MTLTHRLALTATASTLALLGACGSDDSEPEVSRQQASLMVRETMTRAEADVDSLRVQSNSAKGTLTANCDGGGSATASGMVDIKGDPLELNVDVALDYMGCTTSGNVTIDGGLDYSQLVTVGSDDALVYVETMLAGTVVLTGEKEATCDMDLNVVLDSSSGAIVRAEGSACGYAAGELNLSVRRNW